MRRAMNTASMRRRRGPVGIGSSAVTGLGVLSFVLVLAASTIAAPAAEPGVRIQAYVESETVYTGEAFVYQIVVDGADNAVPPDASAFGDDFSAEYLGGQNSSSQSITIVNGNMQREVQRRYVMQFRLTPRRKGKLTIPPVAVSVKGQVFNTNPVTIGVDQPVETQDFKLRMTLSRSTCYVGEPVVLTVTWYIGRDVEDFAFSMPVLGSNDFAVETPEVKIDQTRRYYRIPIGGQEVIAEKGTGTLDGRDYATIVFKKVLIPKRAGTFTIPEMSVQCSAVSGSLRGRDFFDDFFNDNFFGGRRGAMKKYVVPSNAPVVTVRDLPSEGRPQNFTGLVGDYRISTIASPLDVSVGDPITFKVTLSGADYLGNVDLPPLTDQPELATYFKIPDERADGRIVGRTKVFTQTIRAKNENVKEIPPITLSYFDTKTARYETVSSAPIPIVVRPTRVVTAVDAEGVSAGPIGSPLEGWKEGIAYNYEGPEVLVRQQVGLASAFANGGWLAAFLVPPAVFFILLSTVVTKRRRIADAEGRLSRSAFKRFKRRLDALKKGDESGAALCERLLGELRDYLGDKFSTAGSTLTAGDAVRILEARGASPDAVAAIREVLSSCEAGAYAGDHSTASDRSGFIARAREAAEKLERSL
jgi:hypothetical protein